MGLNVDRVEHAHYFSKPGDLEGEDRSRSSESSDAYLVEVSLMVAVVFANERTIAICLIACARIALKILPKASNERPGRLPWAIELCLHQGSALHRRVNVCQSAFATTCPA